MCFCTQHRRVQPFSRLREGQVREFQTSEIAGHVRLGDNKTDSGRWTVAHSLALLLNSCAFWCLVCWQLARYGKMLGHSRLPPEFCRAHRTADLVDVKQRRCQHPAGEWANSVHVAVQHCRRRRLLPLTLPSALSPVRPGLSSSRCCSLSQGALRSLRL